MTSDALATTTTTKIKLKKRRKRKFGKDLLSSHEKTKGAATGKGSFINANLAILATA